MVYDTDETPAGARWYDHARTDPNAGAGTSLTHVMGSFPTVTVIGSSGPPPDVRTDNDYPDVGFVIHAAQGAGNTQLPGSAVIDTYDVMAFHGAAPPGSVRANWTL